MDICIDSQDPLIFHASDVRIRQSMDIAMRLSVRAVIFHTNHIANFRLESYREGWLKKKRCLLAPSARRVSRSDCLSGKYV